ncbi:MAG TPA: hypothetical protein VK604_05995 [Bryobacteraceae bacterium]|nr:hypothetical protein [Bryobacteraceae bacterium]
MTRFVADLRIFIHFGILPLVFVAAIWAAQPWDKHPTAWNPADIARLLSNSPWAQVASATIVDPYDAIEQTDAPLPGAKEAGLAGPSHGGSWDGGVGRNRMGRLPSVPVTVRWESALPIREALRLSSSSTPAMDSYMLARPAEGTAVPEYVITVIGLVQGGKYRAQGKTDNPNVSRSDGEAGKNPDAGNPEEVLEAFMQFSRLRAAGISDIRPANVKLDPATGAVHIFFARTHPLERRQKEVVFLTHFGSLNLQTKFRLTSMMFRGQLEL